MAKGDFVVEVPISIKGAGKASGTAGGRDSSRKDDPILKALKKLDKSIIATFDPVEILTSAFRDLIQLVQPLIRILSLLFLVVFLPLMPIIISLVKVIAGLIEGFRKLFGGEINFAEFIKQFVGPALLGILGAIGDFAILIGKGLWEVFKGLISLLWDGIKFIGEQLANLGNFIWGFITDAFFALGDLAAGIWELIKGLFVGTIDVFVNVWNFIKSLFKGTIDVATMVWNWFKSLFSGSVGGGGSSFVSQARSNIPGGNRIEDILSGNTGSSSSIGGNTVNINNTTVRSSSDIKDMANQVSLALQRSTNGRFS